MAVQQRKLFCMPSNKKRNLIMKKISIVIPVYNKELYLNQCVDSICRQSYENLEIILVDDGSNQKCARMCDEYLQKDSRIKVIHKENGGARAFFGKCSVARKKSREMRFYRYKYMIIFIQSQ